MKPSEQAEMKEMKMTRNYSYGDIITILYKMSMGGWRKERLRLFIYFDGTLQPKNTDLISKAKHKNM